MAGFTLDELGSAAARSLADAQTSLTGELPAPPTVMAIADTTLELKVAVSGKGGEELRVHTIAPDQLRVGAVDPAVLSTVTMRFAALAPAKGQVSTGPGTGGGTGGGTRDVSPGSQRERAIRRIREAADVKRLEAILGPLTYTADIIAGGRLISVVAMDSRGRIVRETGVPISGAN